MLLPFVNLGFVSYCISNECLPIQLGMLTSMFNVMENQFSHLYLFVCGVCLMECACVLGTQRRGFCVCVCVYNTFRGAAVPDLLWRVGDPSDRGRSQTHFMTS